MLSNAFFNLTLEKRPPAVHAEANFGGIEITFTDNAGDELQIVLSPKGIKGIVEALEKAGFLKSSVPGKARAKAPFEVPMSEQQLPA